MPPKGQNQIRGTAVGRPAQPKGFARNVLDEITKQENRAVVTSIAFFAVCMRGITEWDRKGS